jgi:putative FmdB family regulatory protein
VPIYGYRCQACGHEFEVIQRMSDPAGAACPACGGDGSRLFFPAGIVFKGSGFYKTDSRATSTAATGNGTAKPASDGAGSTPAPPAKEASPAAGATPASPAPSSAAKAKPATSTTD